MQNTSTAINLNRYEATLNAVPWASKSIRETFAQVSRSTRLSRHTEDQHHQTIWETSTNVIGPLYVAFVWWLLKNAQQDGVKRLYFMARDGLILKEIADIIIKRSEIKVETQYLYVSRQSLLYASVTDVDHFDIRWMMWNPLTPLSAKKILERIEIPPESIKEELNKFHITDVSKNLSLLEKLRFRKIFAQSQVKALILKKAKPRQESTLAYLRQQRLTDGTPFALIDLGWLALSQYALSRILDKNNYRPKNGVKGYYLGTNWLLWKYKNDTAESFMFNPQNMLWRMPVVQYELPEIFATANDGRTLGYEQQGEKTVPFLGKINQKALAWGSEFQKNGVLAFTQNIVNTLPAEIWNQEIPNAKIRKIFDLFCNWPSDREANVYGSFSHGADIEEKEGHEIAPIISKANLFKIFTGYYWAQGTIVYFSKPIKIGMVNFFTFINLSRHAILYIFDKYFSLY